MSHDDRANEVRAALGDIVGDEIRDRTDVIAARWPIAAYSVTDGRVAVHNVIGGDYCTPQRLLDVAGFGTTDDRGTVELSLNDFHCEDVSGGSGGGLLGYDQPVHVVATARGDAPVFVSVQSRIGSTAADVPNVFITVSSWDKDGAAVGRVPFNWRCLVPVTSIPG